MANMNDFVKALNKITEGVLDDENDDYGLGSHGSELDKDDEEGEGYKQAPMYQQLGKVIDSQGNPNPVNTVVTDDGKTLKVSADQARAIRMLMTTDKIKPMVRTKFQNDMQKSNSLADFLDMDYHELPSLFIKRYLA